MYSSKTHYLLMKQRPFTDRRIKRSTSSTDHDTSGANATCNTCKRPEYPDPPTLKTSSRFNHINRKTSFHIPETKGNVNPQTSKGMNPLKCGHSQKDYYIKRNKYPVLETSSNDFYHRGALSKSEYIEKKRYRNLMLDKKIVPPNETVQETKYCKNKYVSFTKTNNTDLENVYNSSDDKCNNDIYKALPDFVKPK